ncbi:NUDIX hydrolase [Brachybacterium epidermidis]|uniref:NUDIX hydrolase n=1 Tax=Brachybacterium epidermidis TaxID=2781983 RepID=UPI00398ECA79
MSRVSQKVVCYVVQRDKLLVFTHDELPLTVTGVQVPAGSVERGETLEDAARRELEEETGLHASKLRYLGSQEYDLRPMREECAVRHYFRAEVDEYPAEERWSAAEIDPSAGGAPVPWTCWWLPLQDAHVLAGGFGALIGRALSD